VCGSIQRQYQESANISKKIRSKAQDKMKVERETQPVIDRKMQMSSSKIWEMLQL